MLDGIFGFQGILRCYIELGLYFKAITLLLFLLNSKAYNITSAIFYKENHLINNKFHFKVLMNFREKYIFIL